MNDLHIAPCGIICNICSGNQRVKNKCDGCNSTGNKPNYCSKCKIKNCPEKNGISDKPCGECNKFPCSLIKNLNKRYHLKYGENIIENSIHIKSKGIESFNIYANQFWQCPNCKTLLCVHKNTCIKCGKTNELFPKKI